jgi:hypothetical protein
MMIRAANLLTEARRIAGMAGASTITPDRAPVARRIRGEATDFWNDKVAVDRFTGKGGHFVRGRARITGPREVTVAVEHGTQVFRARRGIVIATGTDPAVPPVPGHLTAKRIVIVRMSRSKALSTRVEPFYTAGADRPGHPGRLPVLDRLPAGRGQAAPVHGHVGRELRTAPRQAGSGTRPTCRGQSGARITQTALAAGLRHQHRFLSQSLRSERLRWGPGRR